MISMLVYDRRKKEMQLLIHHSRETIAYCSDDSLEVVSAYDEKQAKEFIERNNLMDAAFLDVTDKVGLELSRQLRQAYEASELLLIADASISPMEYMTPDIRAASLLLRPFTTEQSMYTVDQFFRALYRKQMDTDNEKMMVIENRQGKVTIPYSKIYYLEVREKKVYVRLKEREYSKFETLENMIRELPDEFLRCHRSFVVNKNYINRVKLSENMIYLEDNITVPLSRSYKGQMKEYVNSLRYYKE